VTGLTALPSPITDISSPAVRALRPIGAEAPIRPALVPVADLVAVLTAIIALPASDREHPAVPLALAAVWLLLVRVVERPPSPVSGFADLAGGVARAASFLGVGCWLASAFAAAPVAPAGVLVFTAVAGGMTLLGRVLALPRVGTRPLRTLVVGEEDDATETCAALEQLSGGRLAPVAACGPADLALAVKRTRPQAVLALPSRGFYGRAIQRLTWDLEDSRVPLLVLTGLGDVARRRCGAIRVGTMNVLHVSAAPRHGLRHVAKETWEWLAAAVALVVLVPVFLAVAVVIRLDSPGPALFRQTRVGRHGEHFTMWKFRSMHLDAERRIHEVTSEFDAVLFKHRQDPRVTRVGRVLRRYSIDELPQLINVVTGRMALVGPRPALPSEVAEYEHDMHRRLAVKPGITGLWQVSGRSDLPWQETVRLDLDYVDNWSFDRDLSIVVRTVRAVLSHRGAY
jgi:exopolysaccharide biosynthesis polyprenyl glycosylphosphotransferase